MEVASTKRKPLILVTNDDGIEAKGIHELVNMIKDLGDIVVVAPGGPRSGQSSALTSLSVAPWSVAVSSSVVSAFSPCCAYQRRWMSVGRLESGNRYAGTFQTLPKNAEKRPVCMQTGRPVYQKSPRAAARMK